MNRSPESVPDATPPSTSADDGPLSSGTGGAARLAALWRPLGALLLFVLLAVAHTWPLAPHLTDHLQWGSDPRAMSWALFDLSRNLVGDPLHLMDGSAFYPFRDTLAVLDHQIGNAVLAVPLIVADANPVTVYNFVFLATFALSGFFTYLLVRRMTGSTAAALLAGVAFAFSTARIYSLPHSHLLATQWLPLALLTMHRYLDRATLGRWLAFAVSTLLLALSSWQVAVIGAITIAIVAVWTLVAHGRRPWRRIGGLAAVGVLCVAFLLPLVRVYGEVAARWPPGGGEGPGVDVMLRNSARLESLLAFSKYSRAPYAPWMVEAESPIFPGLVTLLLALPALAILWKARRRWPASGRPARPLRWLWWTAVVLATLVAAVALLVGDAAPVGWLRPMAPVALLGMVMAAAGLWLVRRVGTADRSMALVVTYAAVAVGGLLLAFGPRVTVGEVDIGSGLWRLDLLPIPLLMRAPARFSLLLALGLAVLAGLGMSRLLGRMSRRAGLALTMALLVLLNVDLAFTMPPLDPAPEPSGVDRWLAGSPEPGAVLEFPLFVLDGNYWAMYASQELYDRRNVEGIGYLRPPELRRIRLLPDFSELQIELLWQHFHPRFIVVRGDIYAPEERRAIHRRIDALGRALRPITRDGEDRLYELYDRGSGSRLYRYWPREEILESGGVLRFRAGLTEGRADTVGKIVVLLNGHVLRELGGPETTGAREEVVPLAREHLVWGINTFELRAGYELAEAAPGNPIGATGTTLRADVEVVAEPEGWRIMVNALPFAEETDAFLAQIDAATGDVVDSAGFDLANGDGARELAALVADLPAGAPVAVAVRGSAAAALGVDAAAALADLGVELPAPPGGAIAAVGVKGAAAGTAAVAVGEGEVGVTVGRPEGRRVRLRSLRLEPR